MPFTTRWTVTSFLLSVGILLHGCDSAVKCRNDRGEEVDWFIIYKLPKSVSYQYMDNNTKEWAASGQGIDDRTGAVANTLKPLFDYYDKKTEGFGYILYNDQPPGEKAASKSFGHSKGVVLLDRRTGVWLSHSVPKFPAYRSKNFWPSNGEANAQTFMCVTYSYEDFRNIGSQLKYIHPYSFDSEIPQTFPEELRCVAQRTGFPRYSPWSRKTELTSEGGHLFYSFAKYTRFGDDLFSGFIEKHVNQTLYVRSWGNLHKPLHSNCSLLHHVYNVKTVRLPGTPPIPDTKDHSKWCVTEDGDLVCIADMNREESQMGRGGGAICSQDVAVGEAFRRLIGKFEPCINAHTQDL